MRALISGAGIAGPALPWWLARYGMQVVVVERSADLRVGEHAIDSRGTHQQPSAAFTAYEQHMRPFVHENQQLANFGLRTLIPDSMFAVHVHNVFARAVPVLMRLRVRMDRRIQRAAHAVELPPIRPQVARRQSDPRASLAR